MALREGLIERYREALPIIQELMKDLEWIENEFSPSRANEEERSIVKHLKQIAHKPFDETGWRLEKMVMPVKAKGHLFENAAGRYQIEHTEIYFTCGDTCEVFLPFYDDDESNYTWIPTSIEADHGKYYFTARPEISMSGALVRTRGY